VKRFGAEFFGTFLVVWELRQCCFGRQPFRILHWTAGRIVGVRVDGSEDGFRYQAISRGCHSTRQSPTGLWAGGRFQQKTLLPYVVAQVLGAVAGAGVLFIIASGKAGFDCHSWFCFKWLRCAFSGGIFLGAGLMTEIVMTMMFLLIILGATDKRARKDSPP